MPKAFPPIVLAVLIATGLARTYNKQVGMWAAKVRWPFFGSLTCAVFSVAAVLAIVFFVGGRRLRKALPPLLAAALIASQVSFLILSIPYAFKSFPWGYDHSSFLFRLHEVREIFPALGGWMPWWNGGFEHFVGVTSGVHGFALLNAPLLALMEPHKFAGPALFAWLFVLFPWITALSFRWCGARWTAALVGAIMMTALTRGMFCHLWQCGILGQLVTVGLTPPLAAVGWRLSMMRRGSWGTAVLLGLLAFLSCLWTPGFFTCAGMALGCLLNYDRWISKRRLTLIAMAVCLALVLLAPFVWVILFPSRCVVDFIRVAKASSTLTQRIYSSLNFSGRRILEWHPLLTAYGICGLLFLAGRRMRRWALPAVAVLLAATLVCGFKQRSEFDRIAFQTAAFLTFPAAVFIGRLLSRVPDSPNSAAGFARRIGAAVASGLVVATLFAGLRIAGAHAANSAGFRLWPAEPVVSEFAEWVRANVPQGGRIAIAGQLHMRLDWGRAAYLPILSGREFFGGDYYAFPHGMVEFDCPPRAYRKPVDGYLRYSRAYGITHWCALDAGSAEFFQNSFGDVFKPVAEFKMQSTHITVFRIAEPWADAPSRFLEGSGTVETKENLIVIRPSNQNASRVVLRYNWRKGLSCLTPGASIEPFEVDENLRFIAVRPGGASEIRIGYRPHWSKMRPNFDGSFQH